MQLSSGQPMAARAGARFGRQANFRSEQRPANTCSAQSMQSQHSAQRAQQQQQQASLHHHHNSQQHHYARAQPCARAPASGQLEQVNLQPQQFQLGKYRADTAPVGAHYSQQQHYDHHYEQQLAQRDALMPAAGAQTTTPCHLTSPSPPPPPSYLMQTSPQQQQQQQQHHQWPAATSLIYAPATCPAQQQQQQQPPQPAPEGAPPGFATRQASPASSYLASPSPCNAQLAPGHLTPPGQSRQAATAPVVVAAPLGGRLASPSGASSTISSSESLANMSINLEQYISKRNERERSRVRNVNDAFDNLKSSLPLETDRLSKRMSKVEILRTAIGYIKNLEEVLGYKHLQQQQQQQQLERAGAGSPTAGGASFKRARSGSAGHLMRSSQQVGRLLMAQSHELRGAAARNNDCELGAWRQQRRDALAARPASSLSGQDLSRLEDGASCAGGAGGDSFAPMSKILKRELDAHNKMAAAAAAAAASAQPQARNEADNMECDSNQLVSYIQQQQQQLLLPASGQGGQGGGGGQQTTMATNCRQDTFRGEQTSVEEFRRRQQRHQQQHHQGDQETGGELLAQHERLAQAGFEEFNANVRCYNAAANFDHYY